MNAYTKLIEQNSVRYFNKLKKICRPLSKFNINHFYYGMLSNEGYFTEVGTHLKWLYSYAEQELYKQNPFKRSPALLTSGIYPHKLIKVEAFAQIVESAKKCQVYPFVLVIEKTPHGLVRYGFNVDCESAELQTLLINEFDLLHRFVLYFRNEARDLLETIQENSINFAAEAKDKFYEEPNLPKTHLTQQERLELLRSFGLVDPSLINLTFTPREIDCIRMKLQHKTAAESAQILGLSRRTVENYLNCVREKLNCENKDDWKRKLTQIELIGLHRH